MKLTLYTDGGARYNPGPAGAGIILISETKNQQPKIIKKISKYLGILTNNQAEYQALIIGLKEAKKLGATEIDCFLDSELIVKQLNREYKIRDHDLGPLFIKVWNLSQSFKKVNYYYIPREKNKEADKLVNQAINQEMRGKLPERFSRVRN